MGKVMHENDEILESEKSTNPEYGPGKVFIKLMSV